MNKYTIAIPARIASSRLPGKMLRTLDGKPVVQYVIERVKKVRNCHEIYVLTDSSEVEKLALSLGVNAKITSPSCRSGTERIVSVLDCFKGDWIFNVQGDEPFVDPNLIEVLIDKTNDTTAQIITPVYKILNEEDVKNPNVVKVVRDNVGNALYFSRSPIPYIRDRSNYPKNEQIFWGHLGVYGYRRDVLESYAQCTSSYLEATESLEQLKFLSNGYKIMTCEAKGDTIAIDTEEDLRKAEILIRKQDGHYRTTNSRNF